MSDFCTVFEQSLKKFPDNEEAMVEYIFDSFPEVSTDNLLKLFNQYIEEEMQTGLGISNTIGKNRLTGYKTKIVNLY